jgi:hypothetical protein
MATLNPKKASRNVLQENEVNKGGTVNNKTALWKYMTQAIGIQQP